MTVEHSIRAKPTARDLDSAAATACALYWKWVRTIDEGDIADDEALGDAMNRLTGVVEQRRGRWL